jgi:hypothetical protein
MSIQHSLSYLSHRLVPENGCRLKCFFRFFCEIWHPAAGMNYLSENQQVADEADGSMSSRASLKLAETAFAEHRRIDTRRGLPHSAPMELFARYRPSQRTCAGHILSTRRLGLVPLLVPLALMLAQREAPSPRLWSAAGSAAGIQLLLAGAWLLRSSDRLRTRVARNLAQSMDHWLPLFLFGVQSAFLFVLVAVFWPTIAELGFPATPWLDANVILLTVAVPAYRLSREAAAVAEIQRHVLAEEFFRYLLIALASVFVLGVLTQLIRPSGQRAPEEMVPILLVMWIGGALTVLVCVALFLEHALRKKTPA